MAKHVGARVAVARHQAGLTQRQLAEAAGVPQSTVARIEAGALDPRIGTVERLLRACGMELVMVERPGRGIDRTQIRQLRKLTPSERVDWAAAAAEAVAPWRGAARRRSG